MKISIEISLKCVSKSSIDNIPVLVQTTAWRRAGRSPLSEPMVSWVADAYMRHSASMSYVMLGLVQSMTDIMLFTMNRIRMLNNVY